MGVLKESLYVYAKPNQMTDHEYSDDVAICFAETKADALTKFRKLYDIEIDEIEKVEFNRHGVAILTDY